MASAGDGVRQRRANFEARGYRMVSKLALFHHREKRFDGNFQVENAHAHIFQFLRV
jgi:hypothetical protein